MAVASRDLKTALDRLYTDYDHPDSAADPVHVARRYADQRDREVVAFCAASLAFGRVASVLSSIESLLAPMGAHPARFVEAFDLRHDGGAIHMLGHRWIRGRDLVALICILRTMIRAHGSIEEFFVTGYDSTDRDVGRALDSFSRRACQVDLSAVYRGHAGPRRVNYFFPAPSAGSGCKRLNLFLRWMVRRDGVDLGVWSKVPPSKLIVPLDTHVIRVGRCLGLTRYISPGWRMAAEITNSLRSFDASDPVKYDFALCHLGMMKACGFGHARGDRVCPLRGHCRPLRPRTRTAQLPKRSRVLS